jgi:predicted transcriptional regulator
MAKKTKMKKTSIECYYENQPVFGAQALAVLKAVDKLGSPTRREIAEHLGIQASSVSGRVNALLGTVLIEGEKRRCSVSGIMASPLRIASIREILPQLQLQLPFECIGY